MYRTHPHGIERIADGAIIPTDVGNGDYQEFLSWQYQGNSVAQLVDSPEAVAARIRAAKGRVVSFADALSEQITGPVPASEKLGWDKKEQAARAHLAGTATGAHTAMLKGELDAAGGLDTGLDDLAEKIIAKADFYAVAVARIAGIRRRTMAALDALGNSPTQAEIDATLAAAKADAEAAFAALMAE